MKTLLLFTFSLLTFSAFGQNDLESQVMEHLANEEYKQAIEQCEAAIQTEQYAHNAYFLLAQVYLTSINYCQPSMMETWYIAMLAFKTYQDGYSLYGKHDLEVLNTICDLLPTNEQLLEQGLREGDQVSVECFGKATPVFARRHCQSMQPRK